MRKDSFPTIAFLPALQETGERRLALPGLAEAVLGGLAYLFDTQVRDAATYSGSYHDYLISDRLARKPFPRLAAGFRKFLGNHILREHHLEGTWPGYIHFLASEHKVNARPVFVVADYNLFTTASTAFPLMLFDDSHLPLDRRFVDALLDNAGRVIAGFKRDEAYNFWLTHTDKKRNYRRSAPMNIPVPVVGLRRYLYKYTGLLGLKEFHEAERLQNWIISCFKQSENPSGSPAIFNIPNDADNTSMAIGFLLLNARRKGLALQEHELRPLDFLPMHRDLGRTVRDRYYRTPGENTGAFLTWFKDESRPVFENPGQGIIPLTVNNVDIVINANVVFALALTGRKGTPGYNDAISLLARAIRDDAWEDLSLYYPQRYIFAYAVTRAWRDADARSPELDRAMERLLCRLLDDLESYRGQPGHIPGAFPWGKYDNPVQSTALALISLLNLGRELAEHLGRSMQYDRAVEQAVRLLLDHRRPARPGNKATSGVFKGVSPCFWESGILYSSSLHQLAHWRSNAQTTALILEAFGKFLLSFDLNGDPFLAQRLYLADSNGKLSLKLVPLA